MQVGTVLEDVNAEVDTGLYMDSVGCAQVCPLQPLSIFTTLLDCFFSTVTTFNIIILSN